MFGELDLTQTCMEMELEVRSASLEHLTACIDNMDLNYEAAQKDLKAWLAFHKDNNSE